MANEITLNPVELRKCADEINKCYSQCMTELMHSKALVGSLKGVWSGSAAGAFGANFKELYRRCKNTTQILKRMMNTLYETAAAYESNERNLQNEVAKLPKLPNNTMR
jgi:WXG100 family type VII secretion target